MSEECALSCARMTRFIPGYFPVTAANRESVPGSRACNSRLPQKNSRLAKLGKLGFNPLIQLIIVRQFGGLAGSFAGFPVFCLPGILQSMLDKVRQGLPLLARRIEIAGVEPALERRLQRRPLAVEDREPAAVAVASLVDRRLAERAFVAKAQTLSRGARRRVERIAFPLVAAEPSSSKTRRIIRYIASVAAGVRCSGGA